jgi:thiol:disulfide interchange protein
LSNTDLVWNVGVFTHDVVLAIWALTAVAIAVYLAGLVRFPWEPKPERPGAARWGLAVVWLALGVYLGAGLFGGTLPDIVKAYLPPVESQWSEDYQQALAEAKANGKPVFIDFTGITCTNCRLMEEAVFKQPSVESRLRQFVLVRLYTDRGKHAQENAAMQQRRFGTVELPLYVVQTPDEQAVAKIGYTLTVEAFNQFLDQALEKATAAASPRQ